MKAKQDISCRLQTALAADKAIIQAAKRVEVALSGGLDSIVLFHLLASVRDVWGIELSAVHVHHGLQTEADAWAAFCRNFCERHHIALRVCRVNISADGKGIEATAREARYAEFARSSAPIIALAHHADDQVETFLLAALRGGGLRALSAMPKWRDFAENKLIWRPLLPFLRQELMQYAEQHALPHVEDPSNQNPAYLRNWLRQQVLPNWQTRLPHYKQHLQNSVSLLQDELTLLDEYLAADYRELLSSGRLNLAAWRALSVAKQKALLAYFVRQHDDAFLSPAALANTTEILRTSPQTHQVSLKNGILYAYQNGLWYLKPRWQSETQDACRLQSLWQGQDGWCLMPAKNGLSAADLAKVNSIRAVNKNDVIELNIGRKNIMQLLQEHKVAPIFRPHFLALFDENGECMAVNSLRVAAKYSSENGVLPIFEPQNNWILKPVAR
ncbi:MAG: tRNA lysidine(34) synthetase TilS [Neisseria sp.]|nr:tRNA lysidine(34) synthetase TilS [Neisseria sp.]